MFFNSSNLQIRSRRSPRSTAQNECGDDSRSRPSPRKARRQSRTRAGAVIVEMAVCMPLMILLIFGCLECNSSIFLSQTLTSAAHEGALVGLRQNATAAEVRDRIATIMASRNISDYTVGLKTSGIPFNSLLPGQPFTIVITADKQNSFISIVSLKASVTALRP